MTVTMNGQAPANISGLPIISITTVPQQIPVQGGVTLMNEGASVLILSTDAIPTPANSFSLAINGAVPIPAGAGPLWCSVASGSGSLVVLNKEYNITNPLVTVQQPSAIELVTQQVYTGVTSGIVPIPITLPQAFKAIQVNVQGVAGLPPAALGLLDTTLGPTLNAPAFSGPFISAVKVAGGVNPGFSAIVACANAPGDTVELVIFLNGTLSSSGTITVIGYTDRWFNTRPDGRTYPHGSLSNETATSVGSGVSIGAPLAPLRILIKALIAGINSAGSATISTIIGGTGVDLIPGTVSGNFNIDYEDGLLLDLGASVTWSVAGTGSFIRGVIYYDLVV